MAKRDFYEVLGKLQRQIISPLIKRDFYRMLGVDRSASGRDITVAYRKLALDNHPDNNPDNPGAEERFKEVEEAYAFLRHPVKRQMYDYFGHDKCLKMFSAARGGRLNTVVEKLTLENTLQSSTVSGFGTFDIPKGVYGGTLYDRVVDFGCGEEMKLKVDIDIAEHRLFRREKGNLHLKKKVRKPWFRRTVELPTIDGRKVRVKAGDDWESGKTVRIRNRGLPLIEAPDKRGHMYFTVR